jgi:hypothetical protein
MMTKLCELEPPSPGKGIGAGKRVVVMLGQTEIMAGGGVVLVQFAQHSTAAIGWQ